MLTTTIPFNSAFGVTADNREKHSANKLTIEATEISPYIEYNDKIRSLSIIGASFMDDANTFYEPFLSKIYDDLLVRGHATVFLSFTSFGPRTAKMLFELFENLSFFNQTGKSIDVIWKTKNDENLIALGASFAELFDLKILLEA